MNDTPRDRHARPKRRLFLVPIPSLLISLFTIIFIVGLNNTPYETADSRGRTMGFNDRFSAEHYIIALKNFKLPLLAKPDHFYDLILLFAHIIGSVLLLRRDIAPSVAFWYFAAQVVIFPFAIFGLIYSPHVFREFISGSLDREGVIDIPFIVICHPLWVGTSIFLAIVLRNDKTRTLTPSAS